jgi:vancomycin permeability regulator SanA
MKTETFSGSVTQAYGKDLPSPVKFSGDYEAFETYDEVKAANEVLSNDEMLAVVNNKRKASARAKATTAALEAAGISKPDPNDPATIRANMVKSLMKLHNIPEAVAVQILSAAEQASAVAK